MLESKFSRTLIRSTVEYIKMRVKISIGEGAPKLMIALEPQISLKAPPPPLGLGLELKARKSP